jgi:transposase InsO family protein
MPRKRALTAWLIGSSAAKVLVYQPQHAVAPTTSPRPKRSRVQTLRCPSPWNGEAAKSAWMAVSKRSSATGGTGPRRTAGCTTATREAGVARGVTVRADHGAQYISGHFEWLSAITQWAIWWVTFPQPQTNGVVERFFRTLKEQVVYGRVFHTVADVKAAVATFITRYNASWRLARLGYMSPLDYRLRHAATLPLKMAA